MTKHQANGFEIDDENPMIPLFCVMLAMDEIEHHAPQAWQVFKDMLDMLDIPMHILANTDQINWHIMEEVVKSDAEKLERMTQEEKLEFWRKKADEYFASQGLPND